MILEEDILPKTDEPKRKRGRPPIHHDADDSATTVKPRKPRTGKKTLTEPVDKNEVRSGFYNLYLGICAVGRSTAADQVAEKDFDRLAAGYVHLINRVPALRVVLILLAPLSMLGDAISFYRKFRSGQPPKPIPNAHD